MAGVITHVKRLNMPVPGVIGVVSKPVACERKSPPALLQVVGGHLKSIMSGRLFVFGYTGWKCVLQGTNLSVLCQRRHKC